MLEGEKASNRSKLEPSDNSNPKHWFHSDKSEWRKLSPNTCWTRESTNRISRCLNNYSLNALQCCHFKANNPVETSLFTQNNILTESKPTNPISQMLSVRQQEIKKRRKRLLPNPLIRNCDDNQKGYSLKGDLSGCW